MSEAQGTHFYFMSLYGNGNVWRRSGHLTPPQSWTRFDAFESLLAYVKESTPELADATVLAFDIQPNKI